MKKNLKSFLGVVLSCLLALATTPRPAFAGNGREVGTPVNPDAWSVFGGGCYAGGFVTGCEVAVDYTGNLLPTVANAQTLGTSALPWLTLYSVSQTNTGSDIFGTAGTTLASGKGGTASTQSTVTGLSVLGVYQVGGSDLASTGGGVLVSTTVPVNASYEQIIGGGAGSAVTLTSLPEISTTTVVGGATLVPTGTELILTSTAPVADAVVFTSSTSASATGVVLGAATRSVYFGHVLTLIFNQALDVWLEQSYR